MAEAAEKDNNTSKSKDDVEKPEQSTSSATSDKPPKPPKRDYSVESSVDVEQDKNVEYATVNKRKKLPFPSRPEFVYKPENPLAKMGCLKSILVIVNLFIWVLGASITAIGIWMRVDSEFLDIQTNLDLKQFTSASYVLIIVGVLIMLVGFLGCYGVIASKMCMLIIFSIIIGIVIILEIVVMGLVWSATTHKNFKEDVKLKITIAMQDAMNNPKKAYFFNLVQAKLECCGVNSKADYSRDKEHPMEIPNSCISENGQPYDRGCYDVVVDYLKDKAAIVGGVAAAIVLLQIGLVGYTIFFMCGIKKSADSIF